MNEKSAIETAPAENELRPLSSVGVWLTREGIVYMTILLFVATGAILRSVNLLIFMAGMMTAPLFLNWRVQRHFLKHVRIRRLLPGRIHAGQMVNVQWEVQNLSSQISAWNLVIEDRLQTANLVSESPGKEPVETGSWLTFYTPSESETEYSQTSILQVASLDTEFRSYRCLFAKRGVYELGPAKVTTLFPLGVITARGVHDTHVQVTVAPAIGTLSAQWDRRLRSTALGSEAAHRKVGVNEDDFYAIRSWRSGDNQRHIHWRSTAKRHEPMVRQFEQMSNRDLALVVDLFAPGMNDPLSGARRESALGHCELALSFAATVALQSAGEIKGQISFGISGSQSLFLSDRSRHDLVNRLMREMAVAKPGSSQQLVDLVAQAGRSVSPGTPIYVVSSREQSEAIRESLAGLNVAAQVRWLMVDSEEFRQLFQVDRKADREQWDKLQSKWATYA